MLLDYTPTYAQNNCTDLSSSRRKRLLNCIYYQSNSIILGKRSTEDDLFSIFSGNQGIAEFNDYNQNTVVSLVVNSHLGDFRTDVFKYHQPLQMLFSQFENNLLSLYCLKKLSFLFGPIISESFIIPEQVIQNFRLFQLAFAKNRRSSEKSTIIDHETWRLALFNFWCENRACSYFQSLSFKIPPIFNLSDNATIARVCAYFNLNSDLVNNYIGLHLSSSTIYEKIALLSIKLCRGLIDRSKLRLLVYLISSSFHCQSEFNEMKNAISKFYGLHIKECFEFLCPELVYQLLLCVGKSVKNGTENSHILGQFSILPDKCLETYSKQYLIIGLSEAKASIFKSPSDEFIDFLYSIFGLVHFLDFICFNSISYQIQECFLFALKNYGGLIHPTLRSCLEKLLMTCLQLNKINHFSALLYLAIKLGLFTEITERNAPIRSKFSMMSSVSLLNVLNMSISEFRSENFYQSMKFCTEIAENPSHPFKKLAMVGMDKLFQYTVISEKALALKVVEWKFERSTLPTLFPYHIELQNISMPSENTGASELDMNFYSNLFIRSSSLECLLDLLLVFTSGLIENAQTKKHPNSLRAFEHCISRLVFLSNSEQSQIVDTYSADYFSVYNLSVPWENLIDSISEINSPSSFSEWLFCIAMSTCSFCKTREKKLLQSLFPALVEPFCIVPILPVLIVVSYFSSGGSFFKDFFKNSIFKLLDMENKSNFSILFDILNEVFIIFSKLSISTSTIISEVPTWFNQFSIEELSYLFRISTSLNDLNYTSFFMQLIWSIDSKKISDSVKIETFTQLDDFRSALNINSDESSFGLDRSLLYFISGRQNTLAEATMNMLRNGPIEKFDTLFLKNNSLKMDQELFSYNYEKFSRLSPNRIKLYSEIKQFPSVADRISFSSDIDELSVKYEIEHSSMLKAKFNNSSFSSWDNFRLLNECKNLRKDRDFENSFYVLSKIKFENDTFWTLKYYLELGNWFHGSCKYNIAIEIFQSLAKDQKNTKLLSKIYRKLALSMASSRHFSDPEVIDVFEKAATLDRTCAKVSFELGSFYDSKSQSNSDKTAIILKNFARALLNSRKYDHVIYPRFVTIWLNGPNGISSGDKKVSDLLARFISVASTAQAVNHLSQLISRVGHPKNTDAALIEQFLIKIFTDYSDITLWKMGSVAQSSNEIRKSRIFTIIDKMAPVLKNFEIKIFLEFCRLLISICDMPASAEIFKLNLTKEVRVCKRIVASDMLIAAPNSILVYSPENKEEYDYIRGFEDHCIALPSLQRPKKLRFILNNSKNMTALLKPKDDLRKDCRFMELCRLLNLNFAKFKSKYSIKIFAVTPLNDECGIIEWVENTASFRSILLKSYKKLGISIAIRDLKDILAMQISPYEKFVKFFLPKFTPIFMRWFFEKFPSVFIWRKAISDYTNSLAVMSMVGFIVGLGDRHGENILFDESTGECVHVDFNCLFDKGKTLEYPEKVPFRLTQNLEHACGAGGINSSFKEACFSVMNTAWDSKRSILTNLETFLHDPLVEWSKHKKSINQTSDITNEQASKILKIIERKLSGFIELENFSCEGQVEKLIQHSIDKKNLSEMYIGWSAFL